MTDTTTSELISYNVLISQSNDFRDEKGIIKKTFSLTIKFDVPTDGYIENRRKALQYLLNELVGSQGIVND